jgi:signal transduction histidine kinase
MIHSIFTSFLFLPNLDLLTVGFVVVATVILGFSAYFSDRKNITNQFFFAFAVITALWGSVNYAFYNISDTNIAFILLRFVLFFATWQAFFVFTLFYVLPTPNINFPRWYKFILFPLVLLTSISTLTPLVLKEISAVVDSRITAVVNGPLLPFFGLVSSFLVFAGIFVLLRKIKRVEKKDRKSLKLILVGVFITFTLIIVFNLIFPTLLEDTRFISLGALFVFPFIALTSYAILRHKLFNVRAVWAGVLVFLLAMVSFSEVILARDLVLIIYRSSILILVLVFGVLLIRGVVREVEQREQLAELNKKLQLAYEEVDRLSKAKSEFISIASHQLRTPLTAIKGYISMLIEGTYGAVPKIAKKPLENVYESNERLINLVNNLLDISRIEAGRMEFEPEEAQIEDIIESVVAELKITADQKKLYLKYDKPAQFLPKLLLDKDKIRQVFLNLINNSIKYTNQGGITIKIKNQTDIKNTILITISDTGEGMTKEDLAKLFESFSRGSVGVQLSAEGAGLGLYIARKFVEMHKGKIWAESEGKGKGSTFYVELPTK